jgi:hypothetical protein
MSWTGAPTHTGEHRALARAMLVSLALHACAAHFTLGYAHPDEHFQVLEFGAAKLGVTPVASLPWEHAHRLRPYFLPSVFAGIAGSLRRIGVSDRFVWIESMRWLAALLGWASHLAIVRSARAWLPSAAARVSLGWAFALAFYLPYLDARTSSESFSASFFLLGLAPILAGASSPRRLALAGLALGAAFEARFQAAFLVAGALGWCVVVGRWRWARLAPLLGGLALAFAIGRQLDRFGYGDGAFTPWNYFRENLLEHKAAAFGVSPPWGFVPLIIDIVPPFGALALATIPLAWAKAPRHPLTWASVPFVLVHCAIGHKEARFLAPIAAMAPAMFVLAWPAAMTFTRARWLVAALAIENAVALILYTFVPAFPVFAAYRALAAEAGDRPVEVVALVDDDPFVQAALPLWLPRPPRATVTLYADEATLAASLDRPPTTRRVRWYAELPLAMPRGCAAGWSRLPVERKAALPSWLRPALPNPGFLRCGGGS